MFNELANKEKYFLLLVIFSILFACKKDDQDENALPLVQTIEVTSITHNSVRSGANIQLPNQKPILRKGLCWSINQNPTTERDSFIEYKRQGLQFELAVEKLVPNTTYYIRAFGSNINGTAYGETFTFKTSALPNYQIGERGPAGGYIFYDKGVYSEHWRYLEAAPEKWYNEDGDPNALWGCYGDFMGAEATGIGAGEINTMQITDNCSQLDFGALLCTEYSVEFDGVIYTDWFLPSKDELNEMYINLKINGLGGLEDDYYWSSSETTRIIAWLQGFDNGLQYKNLFRFNSIKVRPVRAF